MEKDYARNVVRVYRADTGAMVEERAMTVQERQMGLDLSAPGEIPVLGEDARQH